MSMRITARLTIAALLASLGAVCCGGQEIEEYQMKAAYLFNFIKFVEWPPQSFASPSSPIVLCVLGEDPFGSALQEAVRGKTAGDRTVVVRPVTDLAGAKRCHIVFVSAATWNHDRPALATLAGNPLLTVGESPGFATKGGIIRFKLDGARLRFEINVEAAQQARLQISSKLLSLAEIIRTRE